RELLAAHAARWAASLTGQVDRYEFRRGFVERVTLPADAFRSHGDRLFSLHPILHVRLTGAWWSLGALAGSPLLGRLTGLDLSGTVLHPPDLRTLLASPHLGRLTELNLSSCNLTDQAVRPLAESPVLRRLTSLDLSRNRLTAEAVRLMVASPHRGRLRA